MKAFRHFNQAYAWLAKNATGDCSILMNIPQLGRLPYIYYYRMGNTLYGPVKV